MNVKQQKLNKNTNLFRPSNFRQQLYHFKPFIKTKANRQNFKQKMKKVDPKIFEILHIKRPDLQDIQIIENRTLSKDEINQINQTPNPKITIESVNVLKNATSIWDRTPLVSTETIPPYVQTLNQEINFQQLMENEQINFYDQYPKLSQKTQQDILDKLSVKHPKRGNDMQILKSNFKLNISNKLDDYIISLMAAKHKTLLIDELELKHRFRDMKAKILRCLLKNDLLIQLPTFSIKGRIQRYLASNGKNLAPEPEFEIIDVRGNVEDPSIIDPLLTVPVTLTNHSTQENNILSPIIYDENSIFGAHPSFSTDGSKLGGAKRKKFSLLNQNPEVS